MDIELENIINLIKSKGLTAYKIAEDTDLTEVGINKILNGTSKNPRKRTLEILHNYLVSTNKEKPVTKDDEFTTMVIDKLFSSDNFKQRLIEYLKESMPIINEETVQYYNSLMEFVKSEERKNKKV